MRRESIINYCKWVICLRYFFFTKMIFLSCFPKGPYFCSSNSLNMFYKTFSWVGFLSHLQDFRVFFASSMSHLETLFRVEKATGHPRIMSSGQANTCLRTSGDSIF